jgi:hypothetical protein
MKTPIEQFIDKTNDIRLSDEAKGRIRSNLLANMRENPIRIISPYISIFNRPVLAIGILLLVATGGATTFAASGSLPGDTFYPIKVNVIEPVRGFMAVSPRAKAVWHTSIVETRLNEVEELAKKNKLTSDESTRSKERFDNSIQEARLNIEELSGDDPKIAEEIDESLEISLGRHEKTLKEVEVVSSSTSSIEAGEFAKHIRKGSRNKRDRDSENNR